MIQGVLDWLSEADKLADNMVALASYGFSSPWSMHMHETEATIRAINKMNKKNKR